jgi:DNA polymerase elongation subunit (family B)
MKCAVIDNVLIPYRPKTEEIERRRAAPPFKGAIVVEPTIGIHSDILAFDFSSLYPTIIISHNISPETFNCGHPECKKKNNVPELGYHFCIKQKGFIPKHLEKLITERRKIKAQMKKLKKGTPEWKRFDNMQYARKVISNATYGYLGFFAARWYKRECGASTASFGRFYITQVIEMAKKAGFEVLYGDTDGVFLRWPKAG